MSEAQERKAETERRRAGRWAAGAAGLTLFLLLAGMWAALYSLSSPVRVGPYLVAGPRSGIRRVRQAAGMVSFLKVGSRDLAYGVYREGVPVGMAVVRDQRSVVSFLPAPTCPPDLALYMEPKAQPRAAAPVGHWFGLLVVRPYDMRRDPVIRIRGMRGGGGT